MQSVALIGIGQSPVREHWDLGIRELAVDALHKAIADSDHIVPDALFVGNMLSGELSGQENLGALVAEAAGLQGIEAVKVEAACASGAAAFRQAMFAVASGMVETAAVVGVEKLTELSGYSTMAGLATAADAEYEAAMGLSFVAINALAMRRYMYEFGYQREDFAPFIINAHDNARHNPLAMFRRNVSREQYLSSKMIADPVALLDSSPIADGAAAVIITNHQRVHDDSRAVRVAACEAATDTIALHGREDPLWLKGVERSAMRAFKSAGVQHRDIDLFELHDAFSIISALSLEASGFAEKGQAIRDLHKGTYSRGGRLPVSIHGGLKGRGHPVGATGIYQICEVALQIRREAPDALQLSDVCCAMTQNIGGSGANVITTILRPWHK